MTDLLTAARQALPGLEWYGDSDSCTAESAVGMVYLHVAPYDGFYCASIAVRFISRQPTVEQMLSDLRTAIYARRDALGAALGEPQHLGTSASDWCGMWDIARARADAAEAKLKVLVASWPAHYHRQGCPWGACNCGADDHNAARAEARRLLEVKDA